MSETTQSAPVSSDPLGRLLYGLAVLALALTPTQMTVSVKHVDLSPSEFVLLLAAIVWVIRWVKVRDTHSLPPVTHWLVVVVALFGLYNLLAPISALHHLPALKHLLTAQQKGEIKLTLIKVAQLAFYLLAGVTVFRAVFTSRERIRIAVIALLATTSLAVGLGVIQWALLQREYQPVPFQRIVFADSKARLRDDQPAPSGPRRMGYWDKEGFHPGHRWQAFFTIQTPSEVSSTFGNWSQHGYHPSRHGYAGFLALVLPFALALLVAERRRLGVTVWIGLLLLGTAISVLAGYVVPVILCGLLVTGFSMGFATGRNVLLCMAGYIIIVTLFTRIFFHSFTAQQAFAEPFTLKITRQEAQYYTSDGVPLVKKFWGEQQAGLNVYRHNPLFGVGSGLYQEAIATGYDTLGEVDRQRLESDAQNGYVLTLVSNGLLGLAALLALLGGYLRLTRAGLFLKRGDPWAAALRGAMLAAVLLLFVTPIWVRGTAILFAAILGMIGSYATPLPAKRILLEEENLTCV